MINSIELKDMKFYSYHGVFPQERKVGNTFIVYLLLTANLDKAIESDNIDDTINYAEVYNLVKTEMEIPSNLLEHVAGRIVKSLKSNFKQLKEIKLKIEKQNPPFGGDIHSAAVIIEEVLK